MDFLTAKVEVIPANDDPLDLIFSLACIISAVLNPNADGFALLFGAAIPAKSSADCCGCEPAKRSSSAFLAGCPNCVCLSVWVRSVRSACPVGCPHPTICAGPLSSSSEKDTASITRLFRFSLFFSLPFSPCSGMQTPIVKECPATIWISFCSSGSRISTGSSVLSKELFPSSPHKLVPQANARPVSELYAMQCEAPHAISVMWRVESEASRRGRYNGSEFSAVRRARNPPLRPSSSTRRCSGSPSRGAMNHAESSAGPAQSAFLQRS